MQLGKHINSKLSHVTLHVIKYCMNLILQMLVSMVLYFKELQKFNYQQA